MSNGEVFEVEGEDGSARANPSMDSRDLARAASGSSLAAHTPGPWEACEPGDYTDFDGNSQVILGNDMRIAVVHWDDGPMRVENDANARLIAAAPELLKACLAARALLIRDLEEPGRTVFWKLVDAISKALGPSAHDTSERSDQTRDDAS